jgi:hypothetical protein
MRRQAALVEEPDADELDELDEVDEVEDVPAELLAVLSLFFSAFVSLVVLLDPPSDFSLAPRPSVRLSVR